MDVDASLRPIDAVQSVLAAKLAFVKANARQTPAPSQLLAFLRALGAAVAPPLARCPPDVRRVVARALARVGWDLKRNAPVRATPPAARELAEMLDGTLGFLAKCARDARAFLAENPVADEAEAPRFLSRARPLARLSGTRRGSPRT